MAIGFSSMFPENKNQCLLINEKRSNDGGVHISIDHGSNGVRGISVRHDSIPDIMLALSYVIGIRPVDPNSRQVLFGTPAHLENIAHELGLYLGARNEADERQKLEDEALELWKSYMVDKQPNDKDYIEWSDLVYTTQEKWLSVARKSREIKARK